jgi:hypothetical protein
MMPSRSAELKEARTMARRATEAGDDGTNDLVVSDVIRTNELQVWFVAEDVVEMRSCKRCNVTDSRSLADSMLDEALEETFRRLRVSAADGRQSRHGHRS